MIRILIADDQELVRTGFRVVLDAEPDLEVVGEAGDALLSPAITRRLIESYTRRPPPTVHPAPLAELTPRELEVLRHVARGLSNTEIASELVVGDATVKTHVAHIFSKLGLHDRAQAVVLAYESGLVQPGGD